MEEFHQLISNYDTFIDIDSQTYQLLYESNPSPNELRKFRLIFKRISEKFSTVFGYHFSESSISPKHFEKKDFDHTARLKQVIDHFLKFNANEFGILAPPEGIEINLSFFNSTQNTTFEVPVNETNNTSVSQNLSLNVRSQENEVNAPNPHPENSSIMSHDQASNLYQIPHMEAEIDCERFFE